MFIAATAALAALLAVADQVPADPPSVQDGATFPVSAERVRKELERPQVLRLPDLSQMGYFRVVIEEALALESVVEAMRRDLAARRGTPISAPTGRPATPVIGTDLLALGRSILKWRAERNARRTVQEALDEFCSTHDCSVLEDEVPVEGVSMPRVQPSSPAPSQ